MIAFSLLIGTSLGAEKVPDTTFGNLAGEVESLHDYRGKVVVLNLWATWCSPCLIEIPHLVGLQSELDPKDATIIGLALDSGSADAIRRFWTRTLNIEPVYPLWLGTVEQAEALFGARTFPTTLIIDREGRIRERLLGLQTRDDLVAALAPYRQPRQASIAAQQVEEFELIGDPERGKEPYLYQCATCHGASGRGDGPEGAAFDSRPSDLTRQDVSAERMFIATRDGGMAVGLRATMPAFRYTFDDETIHDIVAYVLTLRD